MSELNANKQSYIRNTQTSNLRTVRLEVIGGVSERERYFLDGISHFVAGTMTRNDSAYTDYVADKMIELVRDLLAKIKKRQGGGGII